LRHGRDITINCGASATVAATYSAAVSFKPTLHASWSPSGTNVTARLTTTETSHIRARLSGAANCQVNPIAVGKPVKLGAIDVPIGFVPVVVFPELQLYLKGSVSAKAAESASATQTFTATGSLAYAGGKLTPAGKVTDSKSYTAPDASGTADIDLTVGPEVTMSLYGLGGPAASVDAGVHLEAGTGSLPSWALDAVVNAGASLKIPSLGIDKSNDALITKSFPLTHAPTTTDGYMSALSCPTAAVCEATGELNGQPLIAGSSDGGELWEPQALPTGTSEISDVACPATRTCFAVPGTAGPNIILSTTTGGQTWATTTVGTSTTALNSIACTSATHCVATGYNAIAVTTDGGRTWTTQNPPAHTRPDAVTCPTTSVCEATATIVTTTSTIGAVMRSADGGQNWNVIGLGFQGAMGPIACPSAQDCVAFGQKLTLAHVVARTTDGSTWTMAALPLTVGVNDLSCPAVKVCMAAGTHDEGGSGVIRSTDGGASWTTEPLPRGNVAEPLAVACTTATACEVVGVRQTGSYPPLTVAAFGTTDGGTHWDSQIP